MAPRKTWKNRRNTLETRMNSGVQNLAEREGFESRLNPSRAYTDFSTTSESILDFPIKTAIFLYTLL
jgi:hypothetical protein